MAIVTTPRGGSRKFTITTADNGTFIEIGPASGDRLACFWDVQFNPTLDFVGSIQIMGRTYGQAAADASAPFLPIPYRRVNVAGAASDYAIATASIAAAGKIRIPSGGDSVAFLVNCTGGKCDVFSWSMEGSPSP